MKRTDRKTLTIAGILLIAGAVTALSFNYSRLFPPKPEEQRLCGDTQASDFSAQVSTALSIDALVAQEETILLDNARRAHSHVEMWTVMSGIRDSLAASAKDCQHKITPLLKDIALDAYIAERQAYSEWYDYQDVIASEVVTEIWDLYIGGTAGGDMYEKHLYDKAIADYAEQMLLHSCLTKHVSVTPYQGSASMNQILTEKERLINGLQSTYSMIDNEDNWRGLRHNAEELDGYISKDLALFQEWITARNALEPLLEPDVHTIYSSHTRFWMELYYQCLKGGFISNNQL